MIVLAIEFKIRKVIYIGFLPSYRYASSQNLNFYFIKVAGANLN